MKAPGLDLLQHANGQPARAPEGRVISVVMVITKRWPLIMVIARGAKSGRLFTKKGDPGKAPAAEMSTAT